MFTYFLPLDSMHELLPRPFLLSNSVLFFFSLFFCFFWCRALDEAGSWSAFRRTQVNRLASYRIVMIYCETPAVEEVAKQSAS